ncbi:hypothetical protein BWI15_24935 [Kribbella sp. ALI-6-A]|uniref:hypothetical protein n=1 Tax=Kribbella sp. ALI-6-A TaxID=1933817 RepID=UPI00097C0A6A|nr:hypothetical protein [Kribbella sp. ALI-6-A]ONI69782.1 hypothetical protein BWI15_24935 [Kribbella sp. ALI-6-A]
MRDNGLTAATYTSMGGIDPLVTTPVLSALAEAGIAAYCAPPGSEEETKLSAEPEQPEDLAPADDEPMVADSSSKAEAPAKAEVPARKVPAGFEEIFVDADAVDKARGVIDRSTEDAEWKSLVEQFNAPSAPGHDEPPVPRWPASEDVDENSYEPLIDVPAGLIVGDTDEEPPKEPPPRRSDDPHDHYIPPEPARGPRLDWISRAAWLGLTGGPLLLILAALLDFGTGRITLLGVVGFMAGFLTLVIRMNDRLPPEDTPDDGAVV